METKKQQADWSFLPICINVANVRILVVGGGRVAAQKLNTLIKYSRQITVCAPEICKEIKEMNLRLVEKPYAPEILEGHLLVYACTNNRQLNRKIGQQARQNGALVNVADDPAYCDFISPAVFKKGDFSAAFSSNARDVKKSIRWRNKFKKMFEEQP